MEATDSKQGRRTWPPYAGVLALALIFGALAWLPFLSGIVSPVNQFYARIAGWILRACGSDVVIDGAFVLVGKVGFNLRDDRLALSSLFSTLVLTTAFFADRPRRRMVALFLAVLPLNPLWRLLVVVPVATTDYPTAMVILSPLWHFITFAIVVLTSISLFGQVEEVSVQKPEVSTEVTS
jgi:hypothetical protein